METRDRERVLRLRERHREITEPRTFRLGGHEWDLLPGVYAPNLTPSALLYAEWVPYPIGGSFCEIGSGTGYIAVTAAHRGCDRVTAIDIGPVSAENTRKNAERHGVSDRVTVLCGDMFEPLTENDRYDVVFWNSNFVEASFGDPAAPDGPEADRDAMLDLAFCDPGYATHRKFFDGVRDHLNPGGRVLLGFTDLGDDELLERVAREHGWSPVPRRRAVGVYPDGELRYELLELLPV
ncbi:Release factor glutamine methyltransferase [Streptomyces sp. enrichment culture]